LKRKGANIYLYVNPALLNRLKYMGRNFQVEFPGWDDYASRAFAGGFSPGPSGIKTNSRPMDGPASG
jgi:hypothetical protein